MANLASRVWRPCAWSLLPLIILSLSFSACAREDPRLDDLLALQSRSSDSVIRLNERAFDKYAQGKEPRPYSLMLFFAANSLNDRADLQLPKLRREFGYAALAFSESLKGTKDEGKLFFAEVEFGESPNVFRLMGVNSVPMVRRIPPRDIGGQEEVCDPNLYPRSAEGYVQCTESKTKLKAAPVKRPPPLSQGQVALLLAFIILAGPYIGYKLLSLPLLTDKWLWCLGCLFVYWFSVSGGMHNIIRGVPLVAADQSGKPIFFRQGQGQQLGFEGFVAGANYTALGLVLAFATHWLPRIDKPKMRWQILAGCVLVSTFLVIQLVRLYTWKTGYYLRTYWPQGW